MIKTSRLKWEETHDKKYAASSFVNRHLVISEESGKYLLQMYNIRTFERIVNELYSTMDDAKSAAQDIFDNFVAGL